MPAMTSPCACERAQINTERNTHSPSSRSLLTFSPPLSLSLYFSPQPPPHRSHLFLLLSPVFSCLFKFPFDQTRRPMPLLYDWHLTAVRLIFANRLFEESSRARLEVVLARITRVDLLSFVNQWLRQLPPALRTVPSFRRSTSSADLIVLDLALLLINHLSELSASFFFRPARRGQSLLVLFYKYFSISSF